MVLIRKQEKWVALVGIADWLAEDEEALNVYKQSLIADGIADAEKQGLEPTGENSADVMANRFPGMTSDPYNYRIRVVVKCLGPVEDVPEEELIH